MIFRIESLFILKILQILSKCAFIIKTETMLLESSFIGYNAADVRTLY